MGDGRVSYVSDVLAVGTVFGRSSQIIENKTKVVVRVTLCVWEGVGTSFTTGRTDLNQF